MATNILSFRIAARETVEETRRIVVETAKREHQKIMLADPRPASFKREVNGVMGAPEDAFKLGGRIVYTYPRLQEVARVAMEMLFDLSPVLSGRYRLAHALFANGSEVSNLQSWDGRGEILITNYLPYARKIEVGSMTMRVPGSDQVYEEAADMLNKRFSNVAKIFFTWRGVSGGAVMTGKDRNASEYRYPALVIVSR